VYGRAENISQLLKIGEMSDGYRLILVKELITEVSFLKRMVGLKGTKGILGTFGSVLGTNNSFLGTVGSSA
jgi:hypothetical protein